MSNQTRYSYYCFQHGVSTSFSCNEVVKKIVCIEGKELLNENFPESLQHLFQCHKCRTFWEADKYTACPACRSQAHILYQCKNCQTLTLNTTESIFVKSMRFECAACGAKTNANAFLLAHKCKENEAIVLSENASCDLCRNKYDDLTQMATSSNDSAQIVSAPILNPPTDSPKSDKPIFPKTGNSMAEFIADVEKQFQIGRASCRERVLASV